eukprot:scaffold28048_cov60-Phaeocystis_antarctica.AAC.6
MQPSSTHQAPARSAKPPLLLGLVRRDHAVLVFLHHVADHARALHLDVDRAGQRRVQSAALARCLAAVLPPLSAS